LIESADSWPRLKLSGLTSTGIQGLAFPSQLFETGGNEYEPYEEDGEFVHSVEMPGYDPEEAGTAGQEIEA